VGVAISSHRSRNERQDSLLSGLASLVPVRQEHGSTDPLQAPPHQADTGGKAQTGTPQGRKVCQSRGRVLVVAISSRRPHPQRSRQMPGSLFEIQPRISSQPPTDTGNTTGFRSSFRWATARFCLNHAWPSLKSPSSLGHGHPGQPSGLRRPIHSFKPSPRGDTPEEPPVSLLSRCILQVDFKPPAPLAHYSHGQPLQSETHTDSTVSSHLLASWRNPTQYTTGCKLCSIASQVLRFPDSGTTFIHLPHTPLYHLISNQRPLPIPGCTIFTYTPDDWSNQFQAEPPHSGRYTSIASGAIISRPPSYFKPPTSSGCHLTDASCRGSPTTIFQATSSPVRENQT